MGIARSGQEADARPRPAQPSPAPAPALQHPAPADAPPGVPSTSAGGLPVLNSAEQRRAGPITREAEVGQLPNTPAQVLNACSPEEASKKLRTNSEKGMLDLVSPKKYAAKYGARKYVWPVVCTVVCVVMAAVLLYPGGHCHYSTVGEDGPKTFT
eukprot:gene5088-912_t